MKQPLLFIRSFIFYLTAIGLIVMTLGAIAVFTVIHSFWMYLAIGGILAVICSGFWVLFTQQSQEYRILILISLLGMSLIALLIWDWSLNLFPTAYLWLKNAGVIRLIQIATPFCVLFLILTGELARKSSLLDWIIQGVISLYLFVDPSGWLYAYLRTFIPSPSLNPRYEQVLIKLIFRYYTLLDDALDTIELAQLVNKQPLLWADVQRSNTQIYHSLKALDRHYEPLFTDPSTPPGIQAEILEVLQHLYLLTLRTNRLSKAEHQEIDSKQSLDQVEHKHLLQIVKLSGELEAFDLFEFEKELGEIDASKLNQQLAKLDLFQAEVLLENLASYMDDQTVIHYGEQLLMPLTDRAGDYLWIKIGFAYGRHALSLTQEDSYREKAFREAHQCFYQAGYLQGLQEFTWTAGESNS